MTHVMVRLYADEYSFFEAPAEITPIADHEERITLLEPPEMRYLDCWEWFWHEANRC